MPLLTGDTVERNLLDLQVPPIVVPAATTTEVVPDTIAKAEEYAYIEIFNSGANNAFYAFGRDCTNINYNAFLVPGQMLEIKVRERVTVYSVVGTTISITRLRRMDNIQANILKLQ